MRLLLINNNPAVSRLINLSAKKYGYELEEFKSDDFDLNENYDVTITDNEAVSENSILLLRESGNLGDIIYIGPKGLPKPIYANYFLQKPFLPTDFIDMIKKIKKSKNEKEIKKEEAKSINEENIEPFIEHDEDDIDNSGMSALDLDELDSLDLPMPDDELYDEKGEEIDNNKEDENLQEDNAKIDNITSESDVEQVVDELSGEELSISPESDDEDFKLDMQDDNLNEGNPSILDSEDIDEVKQLLIDDAENKETQTVEEEIEIDDEPADENSDIEDVEAEKNEGLVELVQEVEDMKKPEEILQEIESIHDENVKETEVPEEVKEVVIPEQIEEIEQTGVSRVIEEDIVDDTEATEIDQKESFHGDIDNIGKEKLSVDDLTQEDLNDLFGEENLEEKQAKNIDTKQLKEELQTKIEEDVKKILNKDEIKEALKGLELNITISIDEKQK